MMRRVRKFLDAVEARRTINALIRTQVAAGLAPLFLKQGRPYEANAYLSKLIEDGLLERASFIQKTPAMLRLYRRLLWALEIEPRCILEIGVKGGGSTTLWKTLFPQADVIGMDIKLKRWMRQSEDGVHYLRGDQSDGASLRQIAKSHGPFDIVIDDGSHVIDHQVTTLRTLLRHMRPGGLYIIEDINSGLKTGDGHKVEYGEDVWRDFATALLDHLRSNAKDPASPATRATTGAELARKVASRIDEVIIARRVLALRIAEPRPKTSR